MLHYAVLCFCYLTISYYTGLYCTILSYSLLLYSILYSNRFSAYTALETFGALRDSCFCFFRPLRYLSP